MEENTFERRKTGLYLELDSLKQEYKNLFDRSNKIDNKVYITITFLGFLFVFITGIFSGLGQIELSFGKESIPEMIYLVSCLFVVITYVYNLIFFLRLLKPEAIRRVDPDALRLLHLEEMREEMACMELIGLYRETIDEDLDKLHRRCDKFVSGLGFVVANVILAFIAYGMQLVILHPEIVL